MKNTYEKDIKSEQKIKHEVVKYLNRQPDIFWYHPSDRFTSGIPDIIGCVRGKFFAVELKSEKGRIKPIQDFILDKIRATGGLTVVATSVKTVKILIDMIKKGDSCGEGVARKGDDARNKC